MPKQVSNTTFGGREYRKFRDFALLGQGEPPCQRGSKKLISGIVSCETVVICSVGRIKLLKAFYIDLHAFEAVLRPPKTSKITILTPRKRTIYLSDEVFVRP